MYNAQTISSFLICTHLFLFTKLITNYPCCSIGTKLANAITVSEWLKVIGYAVFIVAVSIQKHSVALNKTALLKWKYIIQCAALIKIVTYFLAQ